MLLGTQFFFFLNKGGWVRGANQERKRSSGFTFRAAETGMAVE